MTPWVTWDKGVGLPDQGMWLDPHVKRPLAFVSHAHSDHIRRHETAIMSMETLALAGPRRSAHSQLVGWGETVRHGDATLSLHPAGHMLGSAQLLVSQPGRRLLYTGDVKLRPAGHPPTAVPKCDVLVMESTYGRPHFRFPPGEVALEALVTWARRRLDAGVTPVLLCTALGKAQELMIALGKFGFRFALESRVLPGTRAYGAAGVRLPEYAPLEPDQVEDRLVIAPPAGKAEIRRLARHSCALVSGWALESGFARRFGADLAFPLSDHCDFQELLDLAGAAEPEQVYTVHGYARDLARYLRSRGFRASALAENEQLQLL